MMIFTEEFIESVKKCKTSKELTKKLEQAEEVVSNIRRIRDFLEQKDIDEATQAMIQQNKDY